MFNRDEDQKFKEVETVIGPSVKVEGNFVSEGDIVVEGQVSGIIKTSKNLKVGEAAKIKADVEAANVFDAGEIRGNVKCHDKLEIKSSAKIIGNIETSALSVESGGVINGKCQMLKKEEYLKNETYAEPFDPNKNKKNKK